MSHAAAALAPNRARGEVRLGFALRGERTYVHDAYQQGCLRARTPRTTFDGSAEIVLINTSGGLTCGDRLDQSLEWAADTKLAVTTQAAERIYRAIGEPATIATTLTIGSRATAEWLPQETILFDGARLHRTLDINMAGDSYLMALEAVVLGRSAMGETMATGELEDRWRVRRDGRLIYADVLRIDGDIAELMTHAALGAGYGAFATILRVGQGAGDGLQAVRAALVPGRSAASAWDGMLAIRLLAKDGTVLRDDLVRSLSALRAAPLPRCWSC